MEMVLNSSRNKKNTPFIADMHCHILPGMDDGAPNAEVSLELLRASAKQGIETVVATPHFYPENESPESFLERRKAAVKLLCDHIDKNCDGFSEVLPTICLGAECAYYPGIGSSPRLDQLCICGTRTILLEMPFERWGEGVYRDVFTIYERGMQVIIAHVERYIGLQKRNALGRLIAGGALIQSNAEYFLEKKTSKRALKLLRKGGIHLLGSDCHNTDTRPQNLGAAVAFISDQKIGDALIRDVRLLSFELLVNAERIYVSAVPV